ncbi:SDR family oxidoreductase [Streptomyces acidicola]|uniref:SDR family oxidoreductase n=1 Tax=Streptomyces acidicola TaxID=2596892 RepID=UPI0037ABF88B
MDLGLRNRVNIVTGGTRGLGRAAARELVADGARVVVSGRSEKSVTAAAEELGGPGQAVGVVADNADTATPDRLIAAARDAFQRLDGVLISVGGPPSGTSDLVDDDQWRAAFESVFLGAVRLSRAVAAELGEGGVIGFVLSSSVYEPVPGLAISNAFRPGLAGYAKNLSNELGPEASASSASSPPTSKPTGYANSTPAAATPTPPAPLRPPASPCAATETPDEFDRSAAFLLSPAAAYLTGVMLSIDGGVRRGF